MQTVVDHISTVVRPALRRYLEAERLLPDTLENEPGAAATARQDVMLAARQATDVSPHRN